MNNFERIDIRETETKPIKLIGDTGMLITAGNANKFNTMTATWGSVGMLWNKPVVFIFIRPQRYTFEFVEREPMFTLSFFDPKYKNALNICGTESGRDIDKVAKAGLTPLEVPCGSMAFEEAHYIWECKKLYSDWLEDENFSEQFIQRAVYPKNDFHKMYVAEIINAWQRQSVLRSIFL